jgi:hypothetical protein
MMAKIRFRRDPPAPRDSDAVPKNMCLHCGCVVSASKHKSLQDCIAALRDELSRFR